MSMSISEPNGPENYIPEPNGQSYHNPEPNERSNHSYTKGKLTLLHKTGLISF